MTTELVCPKCQGAMRAYERNRVTVDQCTECRGIFLDRGELDQLLDAEAAYNRAAQPAPVEPQQIGREDGRYGGHHGSGGHGEPGRHGSGRGQRDPRKRRGGFLGELFD